MARQQQVNPEIKIIDATVIDLCASVFPWAPFQKGKGAIKLHTVLSDLLPQCVILTDGRKHEMTVVKEVEFQRGDLLIFDRAYLDYAWLYDLHKKGVWFVSRLKANMCYEVLAKQEITLPPWCWPTKSSASTQLTPRRGILEFCVGFITETQKPAKSISF